MELAQLKEELHSLKERIKKWEQNIQDKEEEIIDLQNKKNQVQKELIKEENILFTKFKPEALVEDNDYSIMREEVPEIKMDLNFVLDEDNDIFEADPVEEKKDNIVLLDANKNKKIYEEIYC